MPAVATSDCARVMKASPHLQVPGFSDSELHRSICKALSFHSATGPVENLVASIRKSYWNEDQVSKAVEGGLRHVVSVDNAAGYAELWNKGGNWYMVTGADPLDPNNDSKLRKSPHWRIYEVPGLYKGMPVDEAVTFFTHKIFGPQGIAKGGCGCGGKAA